MAAGSDRHGVSHAGCGVAKRFTTCAAVETGKKNGPEGSWCWDRAGKSVQRKLFSLLQRRHGRAEFGFVSARPVSILEERERDRQTR